MTPCFTTTTNKDYTAFSTCVKQQMHIALVGSIVKNGGSTCFVLDKLYSSKKLKMFSYKKSE